MNQGEETRKIHSDTNLLRNPGTEEPKNVIEIRELGELLAESIESMQSNTEEVLYLLPIGSNKTQKLLKVDKNKKSNVFYMRIKDELRIDLKKYDPSSLTSLISLRLNNIYPIEEVSESSTNGDVEREIKKNEKMKEIERIMKESMKKANDRPVTRRAWEVKTDNLRESTQPPAEVQHASSQCCGENCYSIQRYLSEEMIPPEITDRDKLIDKISLKPDIRSRSSMLNSSFASSLDSGCCVAKCFRKLGKLCSHQKVKDKKLI